MHALLGPLEKGDRRGQRAVEPLQPLDFARRRDQLLLRIDHARQIGGDLLQPAALRLRGTARGGGSAFLLGQPIRRGGARGGERGRSDPG